MPWQYFHPAAWDNDFVALCTCGNQYNLPLKAASAGGPGAPRAPLGSPGAQGSSQGAPWDQLDPMGPRLDTSGVRVVRELGNGVRVDQIIGKWSQSWSENWKMGSELANAHQVIKVTFKLCAVISESWSMDRKCETHCS